MKYWGRSLIVYLAIVTLLYGTSDVSEAGVRYRGSYLQEGVYAAEED